MFLDVSQVDHSFQFLTTSKAHPDPKAGCGMAACSSNPIIFFLNSASPQKNKTKGVGSLENMETSLNHQIRKYVAKISRTPIYGLFVWLDFRAGIDHVI